MTEQAVSRLSKNLYDKPTILSLTTTSKCNLDCSFCGGLTYMNREDMPRELQRERVFEMLEQNPTIESINWTGGEPLLAIRKIQDLIAEMEVTHPQLTHQLYTNGLKLRKDQLPVLKKFDRIFVSLDGYEKSERPFRRIIDDDAHEVLEVLHELDNFHTWAVVTREQLGDKWWYLDVMKLHTAMYQYKPKSMTLLLDAYMPKPLSPDHVMNLMYGYWKLEENLQKLNVKNDSICGFSFSKMFDTECNICSEVMWLYADGSQEQSRNAPEVVETGCNRLAMSIGPDAYNYIKRVITAKRNRAGQNERAS